MARVFVRCGRRQLVVMAAACLLVGPLARATSSDAANKDAEQVVQGLVEDLWRTLRREGADQKARVDALAGLLETRTDVALISRLALGRYWSRLPEAQRPDY